MRDDYQGSVISASVVVARLLTTENPRRWTGPLGAWVYNEPGPGPVATLVFAGLLLLAFCLWLIGCATKGQIVRWPKWPVLGVLVMSVCTLLAAALAGQKQISMHFAADWISKMHGYLLLPGKGKSRYPCILLPTGSANGSPF